MATVVTVDEPSVPGQTVVLMARDVPGRRFTLVEADRLGDRHSRDAVQPRGGDHELKSRGEGAAQEHDDKVAIAPLRDGRAPLAGRLRRKRRCGEWPRGR